MAATAEDDPRTSGGPGRFRRGVSNAAVSVALAGVFVTALTGALVMHLDLATTRRAVRFIANGVFASTFRGTVVLGEIDRLDLHGLSIRRVTAYDPGGAQVVDAQGLHADADVLAIVRSAAMGDGDIQIRVPLVHLEQADVTLERGPNGVPTIAEVFLMRTPAPPPPPGARKVHVSLDRIAVDHVWAHGAIAPPIAIDTELSRAVVKLEVTPDGVTIETEPSGLIARAPLPQPLTGPTTFRMRTSGGTSRMETTFEGKLGDLDTHVAATLEGTHVSAKLELPRVTPEVLVTLVPIDRKDLPLRVPVAATIEADGDLETDIAVKARIAFESGGFLGANGKIKPSKPLSLDASFEIGGVDPRAVLDVISAAPIAAKGHVHIVAGDKLGVEADITSQPFALAGNSIPSFDARARYDGTRLDGEAVVRETGMPAKASVSFDVAKNELSFDVETRASSLRKIERLAAPVDGSADVKITGTLRGGEIDARVNGHFQGVNVPGSVAIDAGRIDGRVKGPLAKLEVDATVSGEGMRAGDYSWSTVRARAHGPLTGLSLDAKLATSDGESIAAEAALNTNARTVTGVRLHMKRKDGDVSGRVDRIAAAPGGVTVDGITLEGEGVGKLDGGLRVVGKEIVGKLRGHEVDLAKLAKLAGVRAPVAGLANVDVELASSRPGSRQGHVAIEIVDGEVGAMKGLSGLFTASFDGERMRTDGLFRLIAHAAPGEPVEERCEGAIAQVRITGGDAELGGPLLDPTTWRRMYGKVEVAADDWNLRCLARIEPSVKFVVSEVRGKLTTRATIERAPGAALPTVHDVFARTRGLELAGPQGPLAERPDWESRDTNIEIDHASFDGVTGKVGGKIALTDGAVIASVTVGADLDLPALLEHPERRAQAIRKTPISLHLDIPRRQVTAFASLPSFVRDRIPLLGGDVELRGDFDGTIESPSVKVHAGAWGLAHATVVDMPVTTAPTAPGQRPRTTSVPVPALSAWGMPIDIALDASYDGIDAKLSTRVYHARLPIATADAAINVPMADVLADRARPTGRFGAKFTSVPLGEIPYFNDRSIDGRLSGTIALDDLGKQPTIKVDLKMPDLHIGRDLAYQRASVELDVAKRPNEKRPDHGSMRSKIELESKVGGKLELEAFADVAWKNGLIPSVDEDRPANVALTATHLKVSAFGPFVQGVLSRLDGMLDGSARLGWTNLQQSDDAKIAVNLKLTDGVFHIPQLGQELHDATITISGGKKGVILLKELSAKGGKGMIVGKGSARFDGLRFLGAQAEIGIDKDEALPITFEGVPLGEASGKIAVSAEANAKQLAITVKVPEMRVDLPAAIGRGVQALDENPDILVRNAVRAAVEARPADARTLAVTFDIGKIEVNGAMLNLTVTGVKGAPLHLEVGRKTRLSGEVHIPRGRLTVLHKVFEVEQGVIHMRAEDASNPYVNVTARWDSPDGPIYIDYIGLLMPITNEKFKYHSPNIPQDRIIAALLFGGVEQSTAASGGQGQSGIGQNLAAQILAQQFSTQLSDNLSTNIGTGDDGTLRPGLRYKAGEAVIELSTYGAGGSSGATAANAAGGAAPKGQHSLITVDWRFWRNWLLRGRVDVGSDQQNTGLDVLWQYRY